MWVTDHICATDLVNASELFWYNYATKMHMHYWKYDLEKNFKVFSD